MSGILKYSLINFLKGIVAGIGGVAPGLSGSVLLIIMGLYRKTLDALGTLFSSFRKNIRFLLPVVAGMFVGVLLFGKVIDFFLTAYEVPTRFCFLGLILGTVPLFYKEVKKEGFSLKYYPVVLLSAVLGFWLFTRNPNAFPQITDPNFLQSVILGVAVAATAIIPGVDPAVLLSTLGLYEAYVHALAVFDLRVLLPMLIGLAAGAVVISFTMSLLFKKLYTLTFSVIFGIFLSMIPNMLNENCILRADLPSVISVIVMILGFLVSFILGDLPTSKQRLTKIFRKKK